MKEPKSISNLSDFPEVEDKVGWPWNTPCVTSFQDGNYHLPKISIITPTYNQGQFIEETIRSVLLQGYPNLEYIIIDGGSTDNTIEIIKKYESFISYWVSEADEGQSHALNKGFMRATGDLIGWQNSDDFYQPEAFIKAAHCALQFTEIDVFYGRTDFVNENSEYVYSYPVSDFDIHKLIPFINMCNQSMFFRRRIFDEGNFIDPTFKHAMDTDFFLRLAIKGYQFKFIRDYSASYRIHPDSKMNNQIEPFVFESIQLFTRLFEDHSLPLSLRKKARESLRSLCLDQFGKRRISVFQNSFIKLAKTDKKFLFDIEILLKLLISLAGERHLLMLKKISPSKLR